MPRITVDQDKCKGCYLCVAVCPQGAIRADSKLNLRGIKPVKFLRQAKGKSAKDCLGCAMCALVCPDCCIEVYK